MSYISIKNRIMRLDLTCKGLEKVGFMLQVTKVAKQEFFKETRMVSLGRKEVLEIRLCCRGSWNSACNGMEWATESGMRVSYACPVTKAAPPFRFFGSSEVKDFNTSTVLPLIVPLQRLWCYLLLLFSMFEYPLVSDCSSLAVAGYYYLLLFFLFFYRHDGPIIILC